LVCSRLVFSYYCLLATSANRRPGGASGSLCAGRSADRARRVGARLTRARGIGANRINAGSIPLIFQCRLLREREQAPHSVSAVSIGPLAKTPYLLSSTGDRPTPIAAGAAATASSSFAPIARAPAFAASFPREAPQPHHHRTLSQVEQRWFVGAHANVGGGCQSDSLAQAPLKWMMDKALLSGLNFRRDVEVDVLPTPPPISDSYAEFMHGAYKLLTLGQEFYREIGADPVPSSASELRKNINETIDASVFERWRFDGAYRPRNLVRWAQRRNVSLDRLMGVVRADDPSTPI